MNETERQNESLMGMYSEKKPLHFHNCEHNLFFFFLVFSVLFYRKEKDEREGDASQEYSIYRYSLMWQKEEVKRRTKIQFKLFFHLKRF